MHCYCLTIKSTLLIVRIRMEYLLQNLSQAEQQSYVERTGKQDEYIDQKRRIGDVTIKYCTTILE